MRRRSAQLTLLGLRSHGQLPTLAAPGTAGLARVAQRVCRLAAQLGELAGAVQLLALLEVVAVHPVDGHVDVDQGEGGGRQAGQEAKLRRSTAPWYSRCSYAVGDGEDETQDGNMLEQGCCKSELAVGEGALRHPHFHLQWRHALCLEEGLMQLPTQREGA